MSSIVMNRFEETIEITISYSWKLEGSETRRVDHDSWSEFAQVRHRLRFFFTTMWVV